MGNKHNYMSIIISVIVAVILLTAIPILTNISTDCPVYNIGQLNINPDFSDGDYFVDKGSYDYIDSATIIKDENLIPDNIKKGVNIFGVVGTYEGSESGYDVDIVNGGGGNYIKMRVKFSYGGIVDIDGFPNRDDIYLKNVVWLKVWEYCVMWANSEGITQAQATDPAGYTLTQNVKIILAD